MLPFITKVTETASINETQLGERSVKEAYHINYAYSPLHYRTYTATLL